VSVGRDPLDTKLVALQEQAVHLRAQLRGVDTARAALTRLSADADQLAADLEAAEAAATAAWVARDHAVAAQELASRKSGGLLAEVAAWSRLVRRCLAWAEPSWAASRVREALPARVNRFAPQPALVRAAVAALTVHAAALGAPERFDPLRADGASLADRLDAHAAHLATCAQRNTDTAAALRDARAAILAQCRVVRAAWSAARVVDPHVPKLDLRIVRAEAAVAQRAETVDAPAAEPTSPDTPTVEPTDGPATASSPTAADPAALPTAAPTPTGDPPPTEPDGKTTSVRVRATVEVIEVVDPDACEPPSA
jgi:hypothetical protein